MLNLYLNPSVQKYAKKVNNPFYENTQIAVNSRVLVVGGSGSGKTNCFTNYTALTPDTFEHIIVINHGVEEPLYQFLEEKLKKKGRITFFDQDNFPTAQEIFDSRKDPKDEYLVVFDDMIGELDTKAKMKKIKEFFTFGRKISFTLFFLSQDYHSVPTYFRRQLTHLILLKLSSDRDLKEILKNFSLGVSREQLIQMYRISTTGFGNFFKIDIPCTDENKKFTRNFTDDFAIRKVIGHNGEEAAVVLAGPWYHQIQAEKEASKSGMAPKQKKQKVKQPETESSSDED